MKQQLDTELLRKIVTFGIVGVLTAFSYLLLAKLFRELLGLGLLSAGTLAYPLAIFVSYVGQGVFTFRAGLRDERQFARFAITNILGYFVAIAMLSTVPKAFNVDEFVALLMVVCVLPIINFMLYLFWVFDSRRREKSCSAITRNR